MPDSTVCQARQTGKVLRSVMMLLVVITISAVTIFYYVSQQPAGQPGYAKDQTTELHGLIHWERSNIPVANSLLKLYALEGERLTEIATIRPDRAYYRAHDLDSTRPLVLKIFRVSADGAEQLLWETAPVRLTSGRAKYYPVYIPSREERQAGGYAARLEGQVVRQAGRTWLSQGEGHRVRLQGRYLDELGKLGQALVVVKGDYTDATVFKVQGYFVIETDTGDRPLLGRLQVIDWQGARRFVLQGEEDRQLLYVPVNYRLRPTLQNHIGSLVMLTGPEEQDGIKPLNLTVIKP